MYKTELKLKLKFRRIPRELRLKWLQDQIVKSLDKRITSVESFGKYKQKRSIFGVAGPNLPDSQQCFICDKPATIRHHIVPLILGGRSKFNNLVPLCHGCHTEVHKVGPREPRAVVDEAGASRIRELIREMNASR